MTSSAASEEQTKKPAENSKQYRTVKIPFKSHDGYRMFGKLILPLSGKPKGLVIYVQTAEGATVDMKRMKNANETFNYYDIYREKLSKMNIAFFSYQGRGIKMGKEPPRFENIDWDIYNTSTLENKVRDAVSAIEAVRKKKYINSVPIFLMGASESTLLAAETAARVPEQVSGLVLYGVLSTNLRETFRYIMTDGAFLPLRNHFDKDMDNRITKDEYEQGTKDTPANTITPFKTLDADEDGYFTTADIIKLRTKVYVDAVDNNDFKVLQNWAKTSAAVVIPKDWFSDHFEHKTIWEFLSKLDIPIGCFHGALDAMTPIDGLRKLEAKAQRAEKTKMEFHYFDDLDHSLNIINYFKNGELPDGHKAIFSFIEKHMPKK